MSKSGFFFCKAISFCVAHSCKFFFNVMCDMTVHVATGELYVQLYCVLFGAWQM